MFEGGIVSNEYGSNIDSLKNNQRFGETLQMSGDSEREAVYCDFPSSMDQRIKDALMKRGIKQLYSHQKRL